MYLGTRGQGVRPFLSKEDRNPYGNGFWCVRFTPTDFGFNTQIFEVYHIYLQGPINSQFRVYTDMTPYSAAARGDINEWDPNNPLTLHGGQELSFYWNSLATPSPLVVLSCRTAAP